MMCDREECNSFDQCSHDCSECVVDPVIAEEFEEDHHAEGMQIIRSVTFFSVHN